MSAPVVTGAGSAWPATLEQDAAWDGFFARHYAGVRSARRIFAGYGRKTVTGHAGKTARTVEK